MADIGRCADPSYVFGNFTNLLQCNTEYGAFYPDYSFTETNEYTMVVGNCVNEYCRNISPSLEGCKNYYEVTWPGDRPFNFSMAADPGLFYSADVCYGIKSEPNEDIAGPGVYISYLIQLGVVFYLFIFLRAFRLISMLKAWFTRLRGSRSRHRANKHLTKIGKFLVRHDLALRTVLVEFQEAQCWFMLISQAAILAAQRYRRVYEASTLASLWMNQDMAAIILTAGILPVLLGMWSLQKWHWISPWMFILSCATFLTSEVAMFILKVPDPRRLAAIEDISVPSCGGHAPPLSYCIDEEMAMTLLYPSTYFTTYLNPVCLAVWCLTVVIYIWTLVCESIDNKPRRTTRVTCLPLLRLYYWVQRLLQTRWILIFSSIITVIIEILLIGTVCLQALAFWLVQSFGGIDFQNWSFGQLIAIAVWLPVVSKYFLIMVGIESYSRARFPSPYKLIKEKEVNTNTDFEFTPLPSSENIINRE